MNLYFQRRLSLNRFRLKIRYSSNFLIWDSYKYQHRQLAGICDGDCNISSRFYNLPVGWFSCRCNCLNAPFSELPSSQTAKRMGCSWSANHFGLSPICRGSNTPVWTRRNATLQGVRDHSARNSTACTWGTIFFKFNCLTSQNSIFSMTI